MEQKVIPKIKTYHQKDGRFWTTQEPLYRLKTKTEEAAYQKELGNSLGWYYGANLYKCCGVYPKIMTEQTFEGNCYYMCLVCGKESKHCQMPWLSERSWQDMNKPLEQMTVFDLLEEVNQEWKKIPDDASVLIHGERVINVIDGGIKKEKNIEFKARGFMNDVEYWIGCVRGSNDEAIAIMYAEDKDHD